MSFSVSKQSFAVAIAAIVVCSPTLAADVQAFLNNTNSPNGTSAPLDCSGYDYQQPLDSVFFDTARTSDEETGFETIEAFVDSGGAITTGSGSVSSLRFWGISYDFVSTFCQDDNNADTPFNVYFYADSKGEPGALVGSVTGVTATMSDTTIPFAGTTIKQYDASFSGVDVSSASWVGIARQTGVAGCNWLWVDEDLGGSYDDQAYQGGSGPVDTDQTFCSGGGVELPEVEPVPTLAPLGLGILTIGLGVMAYRRRRD